MPAGAHDPVYEAGPAATRDSGDIIRVATHRAGGRSKRPPTRSGGASALVDAASLLVAATRRDHGLLSRAVTAEWRPLQLSPRLWLGPRDVAALACLGELRIADVRPRDGRVDELRCDVRVLEHAINLRVRQRAVYVGIRELRHGVRHRVGAQQLLRIRGLAREDLGGRRGGGLEETFA